MCFCHGLLTAVGLALFASAGGCSDEPKGGPRVEVVPITGKVMIDGNPAADVVVDFRRAAGRGVAFPVPEPVGYTNKEGVIEASTYVTNDGVGPGEYKLLFSKGERVNPFTGESSGDVFKGKYNNYNKPPFTVTIPAELGDEPFDIGTFELTTKQE
jgi:hypothetical protein